MNRCCVYIMANSRMRVLYTGIICKHEERVPTHNSSLMDVFTSNWFADGEITRLVRARPIRDTNDTG
jgi:predicted GIY-YIG superfamily endonuclease